MKILQVCALVSVCVIAAASLFLVAMGYSIRLEAPISQAHVLGGGAAFADDVAASSWTMILMEDGSIYEFRVDSVPDEITVNRVEMAAGGGWPNLPIPISEVLWWDKTWVIGSSGLVYWYSRNRGEWLTEPLPAVPVGAKAGAMSGVKGKYGGSGNN